MRTEPTHTESGPLAGLRVLQLGGIGPVPFAATLMADAGADVVRVDRPGDAQDWTSVLERGRRFVVLDLKSREGRLRAFELATSADVLLEGFRPGVLERIGLAPDTLLAARPSLVIGRMTGYGQTGPLSQEPGHDINYIALAGALGAIGPAGGPPVPPLNLVGDFGGGAMLLLFGVLSAVLHARTSGRGQVVDAAMTDGSITLMGIFQWMRAQGRWSAPRGGNWLDGGAPWYGCYRCSDGRWLAVGAVESPFYRAFIEGLGLAGDTLLANQHDVALWPSQRQRIADVVASRTRDAWCTHFAGRDACVSPVLDLGEVAAHPHNAARGALVQTPGGPQPAAVPRFSLTPARAGDQAPAAASDPEAVRRSWASR